MGGNNEFFENFERNKYLKILPNMQRVKCSSSLNPFSTETVKRAAAFNSLHVG